MWVFAISMVNVEISSGRRSPFQVMKWWVKATGHFCSSQLILLSMSSPKVPLLSLVLRHLTQFYFRSDNFYRFRRNKNKRDLVPRIVAPSQLSHSHGGMVRAKICKFLLRTFSSNSFRTPFRELRDNHVHWNGNAITSASVSCPLRVQRSLFQWSAARFSTRANDITPCTHSFMCWQQLKPQRDTSISAWHLAVYTPTSSSRLAALGKLNFGMK